MRLTTFSWTAARLAGMTLCHLMATVVAALILQQFTTLPGANGPVPSLASLIGVAFIESAAVYWLVIHLRLEGLRLIAVVLLVFHGAKHALMLVEAAAFLVFWVTPPLMTLHEVGVLEIYGLIMASIYCPLAIAIVRAKRAAPACMQPPRLAIQSVAALGPALLMISCIYAACYWLAGAFILLPLAGDAFAPTYNNLQVPWWMPLFQVVRGLIWSLLLLPLVLYGCASPSHLRVGAGVLLSVLGAAQLLNPNVYMSDWLRYSHIVEIAVSMTVFGWLGVFILQRRLATKLVS